MSQVKKSSKKAASSNKTRQPEKVNDRGQAKLQSRLPFRQADYLKSAPGLAQCPPDIGREVAFAGRSNAGKSSALNTLTHKSLARTSKTPGRTQLINFFSLGEQTRLVDLPGYGFAKVPEKMRQEWGRHMGDYIMRRQSLVGLVVVMDMRHPLTEFDQMMIDAALARDLPVHLLLTKADKLKRGPAKAQLLKVRRELREVGVEVTAQLFSALKQEGVQEAWRQLESWLLEDDVDAETSVAEAERDSSQNESSAVTGAIEIKRG
ncbi:hypothetical protein BFW38_16695 [Terasakiispira papahanaumokuakeensis]|uniref:Probable GTP-binding protein EngB n=1 Tax=Terasakiispira papahanaumokuakeensis TaxID=197479 RepID=A0A1E2VD64_9GAMM|nr:hypothetical protein BFW38_16695 [Terasakiispira papahanaumokuakeensis]